MRAGSSRRPGLLQTILLWSAVTVAALAAGTATFLMIAAPTDLIRDHLVEQVRARTGLDIVMSGRASMRFFPRSEVVIGDVTVASPGSMSGEPILRVGSVTAGVLLWPLLRGEVRLDHIVLRRPELVMRIDADGRRNWDFAQAPELRQRLDRHLAGGGLSWLIPEAAAAPRRTRPSASADLGDVRIEEGSVRYLDDRRGLREEVSALNLRLGGSANSPITGVGEFVWRGDRHQISASIDSPEALLARAPARVAIRLQGSQVDAAFEGTIAERSGERLSGEISLKADSLSGLVTRLGMRLSGEASPGAVSVAGKVSASDTSISLTDAEFHLDKLTAKGRVALDTPGAGRPRLHANLELSELDLNRWLALGAPRPQNSKANGKRRQRHPFPGGSEGAPARSINDLLKRDGKAGAGDPQPEDREIPARHGWSEADLDLSLLGLVNANVDLTVDRLAYRDMSIGPARISAQLNDRVLKASFQEMRLYEGVGKGNVNLDATGTAAVLQASFEAEGVSALELLQDAARFDWIAGRGRVSIAIAGRGKSERSIVETLDGTAVFSFHDGALLGFDVPRRIEGLQHGQFHGLERSASEKTSFSELVATFRIKDGVAENRDLRLQSQLLRISGSGTADLPRRTLDYTMRPKLAPQSSSRQEGVRAMTVLELPVRITGSWDQPRYTPDLDAALKNSGQAIEAAKEIGKRLKGKDVDEVLRSLLGREGSEGDKPRASDLFRQLLKPGNEENR